jgi:hypothetical protein
MNPCKWRSGLRELRLESRRLENILAREWLSSESESWRTRGSRRRAAGMKQSGTRPAVAPHWRGTSERGEGRVAARSLAPLYFITQRGQRDVT